MLETFEVKSYKQLEQWLGFFNIVFTVALVIGFYFGVATPIHKTIIDKYLASKLWTIIPLFGVALCWAWVATQILRLHDKIYEPIIRKWRAIYEADFILRALVIRFGITPPISLFEKAYDDKRLRRKLMQRLFYDFIGDETTTATGKRIFFYSEMARYWVMGLASVYCFIALISYGLYTAILIATIKPCVIICTGFVLLLSQIYSNHVLDTAHEISAEQVSAVYVKHEVDWRIAFENVVREENL